MRALRARSVGAVQPPNGARDRALIELAGREFRFAVPAVSSARLPRDPQALANFWKSISDPLTQQSEVDWPAAAWTALAAPTSCIPMIPRDGAGQEFAVVSFVDLPDSTSVLSTVNVRLAPTASKFSQPVILSASARVVTD